jgi:hypothetical protein
MVSHAGVALFIFGNKRAADGTIQLATGVEEEFRLAAEAGLAVVPLGSTGYMAAELHQRVLENFDRFYPTRPDLQPAFEALGRITDTRGLLEETLNFVSKLREGL